VIQPRVAIEEEGKSSEDEKEMEDKK